ncbi:hypothetical protein ACFS07_12110 [Undibacterium arcticum]
MRRNGKFCRDRTPTSLPVSKNILDNLVDPAHTTFVHKKTIGGADASDVPLTVEQKRRHPCGRSMDRTVRAGSHHAQVWKFSGPDRPLAVLQRVPAEHFSGRHGCG